MLPLNSSSAPEEEDVLCLLLVALAPTICTSGSLAPTICTSGSLRCKPTSGQREGGREREGERGREREGEGEGERGREGEMEGGREREGGKEPQRNKLVFFLLMIAYTIDKHRYCSCAAQLRLTAIPGATVGCGGREVEGKPLALLK